MAGSGVFWSISAFCLVFKTKTNLKQVSSSSFVEFQEKEHIFVLQKYQGKKYLPGKDLSFILHEAKWNPPKPSLNSQEPLK